MEPGDGEWTTPTAIINKQRNDNEQNEEREEDKKKGKMPMEEEWYE